MKNFNIESRTIADFWGMHTREELELRPEYQRKFVWPLQARISLMESVLLEYPIPEIYLEYRTDAKGNQTVAVVDGQQRLSSLIQFLSNEYPLGELTHEKTKQYSGLYFKDLPEQVRTEFFQYTLPVRKLLNQDESIIREIFARVNRVNLTLTPQELRNALMPGPFTDFLKDCVSHPLNGTAGLFSETRQKRGGDLEFYADVFGACIFGLSNKKKEFEKRYDELSSNFEKFQPQADEFLNVLTITKDFPIWNHRVRWSNIIDMYTLLIVSNDHVVTLERLNHAERAPLAKGLDYFQAGVNEIKREAESRKDGERLAEFLKLSPEETSTILNEYASGIRNSSDLAARRLRRNSLDKIFQFILY